MAVNKNFVVKQGLEVKENLLVAEGTTSRVGIGTTDPLYTAHVIGGIGATDLYVSGVSTFSGAIDANGAIDVDGHTELDDVNVSGASTFTGIGTFISDLYVGGNLNVTGDLTYDEVSGRNLDISGIATIATLYAAAGIITASNVHVSAATTTKDLLVTGVSTFSGIGTFASDVYVDGNLNVVGDIVYDEVSGRNLDISGIATIATLGVSIAATTKDLLVTGLSTFTGAIDANGAIDVDGHTELDDVNVSGASTFAGAADFNGAIDVDGHTELDDVNVSGASTFTGAADFNGALDVDGHTELDDVNVSGASTFTGAIDANGALDVDGHTELDDVNVSGVSTLATLGVSIAATTKDLLVTGVTTAGIVTGATYYGDGSNLIGVSTTFTGSIGIQSGGTVIGTGITMVNITGGGSTAWASSNVATIKLPEASGVSIGMVIALS